jgi:hypothetical protein
MFCSLLGHEALAHGHGDTELECSNDIVGSTRTNQSLKLLAKGDTTSASSGALTDFPLATTPRKIPSTSMTVHARGVRRAVDGTERHILETSRIAKGFSERGRAPLDFTNLTLRYSCHVSISLMNVKDLAGKPVI